MQSCDLQLAAGTAQQHGIDWKLAEMLVLTHEQWSQQFAWQHVMHTRQTRSNKCHRKCRDPEAGK